MRALGLLSRQRTTPSGCGSLESLDHQEDLGACQRQQTQHGGRGCEKSSCRRSWRIDQAMEKGFTWEVKGVLHKEQLMERPGRKRH